MKFYSFKIRDYVDVPDKKVKVVMMKNGKKSAQAVVEKDGKVLKLIKILSN